MGGDSAHQAMSYHVYTCGFADPSCDRNGNPRKADCPECDSYAADHINMRAQEAVKLKSGSFLSEFGACSNGKSCLAEIRRVATRADVALQSWAYWQFKYFDDITTVSGPLESFYDERGAL